MRHVRFVSFIGSALLVTTAFLGGCGGPEIPELRVPVERQHAIRSLSETPLNLPEDQPFAIHVKRSSQEPGPDGKAEGGSDATPAGEAWCAAKASNGGQAAAEFTLGHRIDNQGGAAQSATLQVDFEMKTNVSASDTPAPQTASSARLELLVVDSRRRVLARIPLLQGASDAAAAEGVIHEQRNLRVLFQPRQSYDVVLGGKVTAQAASGQSAEARVDAGKVKMRLTFAPVATQPATQTAANE